MANNTRFYAYVNYLKNSGGIGKTAREIAEWWIKEFPKKADEKRKESVQDLSGDKLVNQLVAEITGPYKPKLKNSGITVSGTRPTKFTFAPDEVAELPCSQAADKEKILEESLYPKLEEYLKSEGLGPKRIDEKSASNTKGPKGNRWLFPDMVAMQDLRADYDHHVVTLAKKMAEPKFLIWSFEVKISLSMSNVRESFFQAVSNSSWANYGYLVASEIYDDAMKELRILSNSHGIGVIILDKENPTESDIVIPAEINELDFDVLNRIAKQGGDFKEFIRDVAQKMAIEGC